MGLGPADAATVYECLVRALSDDSAVRKPAEEMLSSYQGRAGFCSILADVIEDKSRGGEGEGARWLAAVYFKNGIDRFWRQRRNAPCIGEEEKAALRARLLRLVHEHNQMVAIQLAVLIAKVARVDFPQAWPELFRHLLNLLQGADLVLNHRVFLTLHHILKELSSKRLVSDQKHFADITQQLFPAVWQQWCTDTQTLNRMMHSVLFEGRPYEGEERPHMQLCLERWQLCLKVVRRLVLFGYSSDAKSLQEVPLVQQAVPTMLQVLQQLEGQFRPRALARQADVEAGLLQLIETGCVKLVKTMVEIQATHPWSFRTSPILGATLQHCYVQILTAHESGVATLDRLLIQYMVFIHNVLKCVAYRRAFSASSMSAGHAQGAPTPRGELLQRLSKEVKELLDAFFTPGQLTRLACVLVERFLVLRASDLEEWAADPEGFALEQEVVNWKDRLRPCAEALYLTLLENFRAPLAPVVMQLLEDCNRSCPPPASPEQDVELTPALLRKEAVYNAVGIAAFDLYDYLDFSLLFHSNLVREMHLTHPNARLLLRRCSWLVGRWVSKVNSDIRVESYRCLLRLLRHPDGAVKLAACASLRCLVEDWNFTEEGFVEFVPECLRALFDFLKGSGEYDTQLQVFSLVSLIIERLGERMGPFAHTVTAMLPHVWEGAEGQPLLRIQVLVASQRLVFALGPQSPSIYAFVLPVVGHSAKPSGPEALNLLEDGLQLWHTVVKHAPQMVPELLQLFPLLLELVQQTLEHVQVVMRLLESYVLLGGRPFLEAYGNMTAQILRTTLGNVKEKGTLLVIPVLDTLVQCFPHEAPPLLEPVLQKALLLLYAGESDLVCAGVAALFARIIVQNAGYFEQFISAAPVREQSDGSPEGPLYVFLDVFLDKVDSMGTIPKRKITALALCTLLTVRDPTMLQRLELIVNACTSVLYETEGDQDRIPNGYDYWVARSDTAEESREDDAAESEFSRRRHIFNADPVNKLSLLAVFKEKLEECMAIHGQDRFNAVVNAMHPSIVEQLQKWVGRSPPQHQPA